MLVKLLFIFDEKCAVVLRYSNIPFKYRYLYHDKNIAVHRCIVAALIECPFGIPMHSQINGKNVL